MSHSIYDKSDLKGHQDIIVSMCRTSRMGRIHIQQIGENTYQSAENMPHLGHFSVQTCRHLFAFVVFQQSWSDNLRPVIPRQATGSSRSACCLQECSAEA